MGGRSGRSLLCPGRAERDFRGSWTTAGCLPVGRNNLGPNSWRDEGVSTRSHRTHTHALTAPQTRQGWHPRTWPSARIIIPRISPTKFVISETKNDLTFRALELAKNGTNSFFFLLRFQTPVTLCSDDLWTILVVRLAHSADLRSRLRRVFDAPCVAYSTGCSRVITHPGIKPVRRC